MAAIEVTDIRLVSPNPSGCCDPYKWTISLNVRGPQAPQGIVEIGVSFGDPECDPDKDVVLEELEVDGSSLKVGRNILTIEHDALPFDQLVAMMDDAQIQCPIMIAFKYNRDGGDDDESPSAAAGSSSSSFEEFHVCGAQVNIRLRDGLNLEEIETFDSPSMLVREVLCDKAKFGRGLVHTPRLINWDDDGVAVVKGAAASVVVAAAMVEPPKASVAVAVPAAASSPSSVSSSSSDSDSEEEMFGGDDDDEDGPDPKKLRTE